MARTTWVAVAAVLAVACGSESEGGSPGGSGGAAGAAGAPAKPTQILFNDWKAQPNSVKSVSPDGSDEQLVFEAERVWSMGVSHDSNQIAYSSGGQAELDQYGLTLGDSIQQTYVYDRQSDSSELVNDGNINDECHNFSADDQTVYVCRRYDFVQAADGSASFKGWRIGRIDLASKQFEFLTPEVDLQYALNPQPNADQTSMLYTIIDIVPPNSQNRSIVRQALPAGSPTQVRDQASTPALAPDGERYAFADWTDQFHIYVSNPGGASKVKVAAERATSVVWSPDGTRLAMLVDDATANCAHIVTVAADGSEANAPVMVRDCTERDEFITELAWAEEP